MGFELLQCYSEVNVNNTHEVSHLHLIDLTTSDLRPPNVLEPPLPDFHRSTRARCLCITNLFPDSDAMRLGHFPLIDCS